MKKCLLLIALFVFSLVAHAQQTLGLTSTVPATGACFFDNWIQASSTSSYWYVSPAANTYYSINSSDAVVVGTVKDQFIIDDNTGTTGEIYDHTKKLYLAPSSTALIASSTPFTWDFDITSACPPSTGGGGTTPPPVSSTITVMPLGDSETWGLDTEASEIQNGYRCTFYWSAITLLGSTIDMVGSSQNIPNQTATPVSSSTVGNALPGCPSNAQGWSGYGGTTIQQMVSGGLVATTSYTYPGALGDISTYQPNVIIFQGGTNDIYLGSATVNVTTDLTNALNSMFSVDPNALIVVASIPAFLSGGSGVQPYMVTNVPIVNAQIAAVVSSFQAANKNVILDTSYIGIPANLTNIPDGFTHPSAYVYNVHGFALAKQLLPYLQAMASASSSEEKTAVVSRRIKAANTVQSMSH